MLLSVTLDDATGAPVVLHETTKRALTHVSGLVGIASPREAKRVRPTAHGAINEAHYEDGRAIALEGEIISQVSQSDAYAEFRIVTVPMLQTLDVGAALLKWTEGNDGLSLQRYVKLDSAVDPPLEEGAAILRYQAQFFAGDPRAYSQTLRTVSSTALAATLGGLVFPMTLPLTFSDANAGSVVVTNGGNRPTPPVFRYYGYAATPQILLETGQRHVFTGSIAAGDYLEVGTDLNGNRYVKMNGVTSRLDMRTPSTSTWFDIPVGVSTVQALASASDANARLDVLTRDAYA